MIAITGAAGFIGSCLARQLYAEGAELLLIDAFGQESKEPNLSGLETCLKIDRMEFLQCMDELPIHLFYHLGARTDTTEFDETIFNTLNLNYSKSVWEYCTSRNIPLIYASSAATYGAAESGFSEDSDHIRQLQPLNPYGWSKQHFDLWVLEQSEQPPFYAGLKFFNVFGPNEYHKGRMASVVYHTFNQILTNGYVRLFESHRPDVAHGEQMRDFIYVRDVVDVLKFWAGPDRVSGMYNLGSGIARTFNDLATAVFAAMSMEPDIRYIPTPIDIRNTYQYFTCADMTATRQAGYSSPFYTLEQAVTEYVQQFLLPGKHYHPI